MPTYNFAYTSFLNGSELQYLRELLGYLRGTNAKVESIEHLDLTGTDVARIEEHMIDDPANILRVVITGSVEAERSDNSLHGGIPAYFGSAQDKVEEAAFAHTDSWDIGFVHLLDIAEVPGARALGTVTSHLLNGEPLPLPVHIFSETDIAAALEPQKAL